MNQYQGRESCALPAKRAVSERRTRAAGPAGLAGHAGPDESGRLAGRVTTAGFGPSGGETS
ncbi:hypothetical protein [Streptosporangium sp. G12]